MCLRLLDVMISANQRNKQHILNGSDDDAAAAAVFVCLAAVSVSPECAFCASALISNCSAVFFLSQCVLCTILCCTQSDAALERNDTRNSHETVAGTERT